MPITLKHSAMFFMIALLAGCVPPGVDSNQPVSDTRSPQTEIVFWQSVQDSTNASSFEAYLAQYPYGDFAALARVKIAELTAPQTASIPPAPGFRITAIDEVLTVARIGNVRATPNAASSEIGTLTPGSFVEVTGKTAVSGQSWYRIALAGDKSGYVSTKLFEKPTVGSMPVQPSAVIIPRSEGDVFRDCPQCPEMVVIPSGSFRMGDLAGDSDENDELPVHTVNIGYIFAVGKFEVTVGEYFTCLRAGQCGEPQWREPGDKYNATTGDDDYYRRMGDALTGKNYPITGVSLKNVKQYVRWLKSTSGQPYRLLSDAEWEYMARAGTSTKYPWGDEVGYGNANCYQSSCGDDYTYSSPIGSFKPNNFGIYDTIGNVVERVEDCYHATYNDAPTNGEAWITGGDCTRGILRGGSWRFEPSSNYASARFGYDTTDRDAIHGFRVARSF